MYIYIIIIYNIIYNIIYIYYFDMCEFSEDLLGMDDICIHLLLSYVSRVNPPINGVNLRNRDFRASQGPSPRSKSRNGNNNWLWQPEMASILVAL